MTMHIPKWIFAAFVGAAPMVGLVFFILVSCTLLGLVQRCKINLAKSYAKRRRLTTSYDQTSIIHENPNNEILLHHHHQLSSTIIVSPFDDIPMKDIDADSASKDEEFSWDSPKFRCNRSMERSQTGSDYDNGSSSIFNDNDYEQDRLSLIETSSQRRMSTKQQAPDTIINI